MRAAARQQVTGIVVNRHPNVSRRSYDTLKATLTNCVRFGAAGQNRAAVSDFRAHLQGRVAHVQQVNPVRGRKLKILFDQIRWP